MSALKLDEGLINVIIRGAADGLAMANMSPEPIGASRHLSAKHEVSAIIGFVGAICGSMSINMSSNAAKIITGRVLGTTQTELNTDALDAICEVLNIIAGKIKAILSTTETKIEKISTPSVVVGNNFYLSHYKGMQTINVEFELPDVVKAHHNLESIFTVGISMMRVS